MSSSRLRKARHDWHVVLSLQQFRGLLFYRHMRNGGGDKNGVGGMGYHGKDWRQEIIEYTKTGPNSDRGIFTSCIQYTRHISGCKLVLQLKQLSEHFQLLSLTTESPAAALKLAPAHSQATSFHLLTLNLFAFHF